jgi:hypothetical protein
MHLKSITALGFATALIAFGTVPASAHVNPSNDAIETHENSVVRHNVAPSEFRRGGSCSCHRGGGRAASFHHFHRASVRTTSFHRHSYARVNVRFNGGHRATPAWVSSPRLAYNNRVLSPRLTNNRVQSPRLTNTRVQAPRIAQNRPQVRRPVQNNPRPAWRNNPLLDLRSG